MNRDQYDSLLSWKASEYRKPLVLRGVRQSGKTYLLQKFGRREYEHCHYFNFEEDPRLASLFAGNLDPDRMIKDLSLVQKRDIRKGADLIVFDEIQACNGALNSLKYFNERANDYHIASAGSLLGIRMSSPKSFPVGKVDFLDLYPMTFYEFLEAVGQERYRTYLENLEAIEPIPEAFHSDLTDQLHHYFHVGGMPEAVSRHAGGSTPMDVRGTQKAVLDSYILDFAKHAPTHDIPKLSLVWDSLPTQLARENKKFLFSLLKKGARAREYENALAWLSGAGLILRSILTCTPKMPLKAYREASGFKIYACDVGLLGALSNAPVDLVPGEDSIMTEYHGAFVENYVAQHLVAERGDGLYYWKNIGRASEVDFLIQEGPAILPLEVKAGVNVKSKSLAFYASKYEPPFTLRTSLRNLRIDGKVVNIPLYALQSLSGILRLL